MAGLEGTVDVPVIGKAKKSYVAVGVAAIVGVAGFAWYRRVQGDQAAAAPGYYADTRTGSELPTDDYTNPGSNEDGQSGTGIGGDSGWRAPTTNEAWAQQVLDRLTWYEPSAVSAAIGKYLTRQQVTADEATMIREAWAQVGRPPVDQPLLTSTTTPPTTTPAPTPKYYRGWGWYKADGKKDSTYIAKKYGLTLPVYYAMNPNLPRVPPKGTYVKVRAESNPLTGYKGK
jgi:hypothetical protein